MHILSEKELKELKKKYPAGTRIRLIHMPDDPYPIPDSTEGTVIEVNRAGQIAVKWDNGSSLLLIVGVDEYEKAHT